jgi:hypothetical protein
MINLEDVKDVVFLSKGFEASRELLINPLHELVSKQLKWGTQPAWWERLPCRSFSDMWVRGY